MKGFNRSEADCLVAFFRKKRFTRSSQVSQYIRTHNMRDEWPNITGYLTMESNYGGGRWNFDGGISPAYFAYVCRELDLNGNGSDSHVVGFHSYSSRRYRYA